MGGVSLRVLMIKPSKSGVWNRLERKGAITHKLVAPNSMRETRPYGLVIARKEAPMEHN
jgi:hypothetical protein